MLSEAGGSDSALSTGNQYLLYSHPKQKMEEPQTAVLFLCDDVAGGCICCIEQLQALMVTVGVQLCCTFYIRSCFLCVPASVVVFKSTFRAHMHAIHWEMDAYGREAASCNICMAF